MSNVELSPWTQLRVKIVELFANLFGVPQTIHREEFSEVKLRDIDLYVDDCILIAKRVFEMDEDEIDKFQSWIYPHLVENMDNPFNLHDGAFYEVCAWHGILLGNDPRLPALHDKLIAEKAAGMVLNDWREQGEPA